MNIRGIEISCRDWMDDAASHLATALTQCGSFKTLDRSFGPEIDRELNRIIKDPNANPKDVCRLSNKLSTDFLMVAEVVFSDVVSPGVDVATGLPIPPRSGIFAEVRYRCVLAPTTEIAWSEALQVDSMYFGGTAEQFSSASAQFAAQQVAMTIQSRLDPDGFAAWQKQEEARRRAMEAPQPPPAQAAPQPPAVPKIF